MVGSSEGPLYRCADPAGTIHSRTLILQSILPSISSIFSIHPDCIRLVLFLSSLHLSSSNSHRILTNLPPSVYHPKRLRRYQPDTVQPAAPPPRVIYHTLRLVHRCPPVSPGGSASGLFLRHGRLPSGEISLWAGDLSLHTFASNVFKR
jgi:hypothetical protein